METFRTILFIFFFLNLIRQHAPTYDELQGKVDSMLHSRWFDPLIMAITWIDLVTRFKREM